MLKLLENLEDFPFLGTALAPHEVAYLEGDQVGRGSPPGFAGQLRLVEVLGNREQAVDDSVEVENDVAVEVIHGLVGELSTRLLYLFDVAEAVLLEFLQQQPRLLIVVVLLHFGHEILDFRLLVLDHIVEGHFHPHEHRVDVAVLLLHSDVLFSVQKVVFVGEFLPKLLTPFR